MSDIEKEALALLNEVRSERGYAPIDHLYRTNPESEALCRAIEQHEAFRQEVSDAVVEYFGPKHLDVILAGHLLSRFIIPKPKTDPLVDVLLEMELSSDLEEGQHDAKYLRAKLDARGFEIREKNDD